MGKPRETSISGNRRARYSCIKTEPASATDPGIFEGLQNYRHNEFSSRSYTKIPLIQRLVLLDAFLTRWELSGKGVQVKQKEKDGAGRDKCNSGMLGQ